ncbi:MAG: nucleotidyltransferase domain-containing protein [Terriglobia bacterium]
MAELVERLKSSAGSNLSSVVLYGSAAAGEFHPRHSDLNILCLLARLEAADLARLSPPTRWWTKKGHPAALLFTLEELRHSADVFAIELLDIQASHRLLFGADPFPSLTVPLTLHRHQVERELRQNLIRLRESYVSAAGDAKWILKLMTGSVSTFATLFRHALIALGEKPAGSRMEATNQLASLLGFDPGAFLTILSVREGKLRGREIGIESVFANYLQAATKVAEEIDRRFQ